MYKEYYRFSEEPFALSPDPKFLFLARSHYEAFSSMMSGIKEKKGLIVITGEVGVGKTILIYALLKDLSEKIKTAFIFQPRLDFKDLLKHILRDLEVPIEEKEENIRSLVSQFGEYLNERDARGETVTVVIDEAQSLEDEVLEELGRLPNLGTPGAHLVQILLVGQPELEARLNSDKLRSFKKKIALQRKILPLARDEGRGYVRHRLKLAGRSLSEVFTLDAVDRVWEFAEGIPRVMNLVCDRALLVGYGDSKPIIDSKIINTAIEDFDYLRPRKTGILQPVFSRVKAHYKLISILIVLIVGLGAFSLLHRDSGSPTLQIKGKMLPPEERPAVKPAEEPPPAKPAEEPPREKPKEASVAKRAEEIFEVKKGWNLSLIARNYYPAANISLLDFILETNPQVSDSNRIFPGQMIKIPAITDESPLLRVSENVYHIHLGTFVSPQEGRFYQDEPLLKGKKLQVLPRKVSSQVTWYRMVAGEYNTKEEALGAIQALKAKNLLPLMECLAKK